MDQQLPPLEIVPATQAEAFAFVDRHHRHHRAPVGAVFCLAVARGGQIVGVATCGRPVARRLDDGWTLEVNRLCTLDAPEAKHAASKLYNACWRAAVALGYRKLITYCLADETGTSLVAAGWRYVGVRGGGSWDCPSRPRVDTHPLGQKTLWERAI